MFPCARAEGAGRYAAAVFSNTACSRHHINLLGLALRAEFSSLSFPKEKETEKKGNLRACTLKDPPNCTDLLRSIKNGVFIIAEITGRASRDEIVQKGKKNEK